MNRFGINSFVGVALLSSAMRAIVVVTGYNTIITRSYNSNLMRLAILGDVHGNLHAFEAALAHARAQSPDQIVLLGDYMIGCPDAVSCWQLACSLGATMLRGNHERYVMDYDTQHGDPKWYTDAWLPLQWTVAQLTESDRNIMRRLPICTQISDLDDMLFMHAGPANDMLTVAQHDADSIIARLVNGHRATWFVRGHNHVPMHRTWNGRTIITNGSVGLPLSGHNLSEYALIDGDIAHRSIQHVRVPYDHAGSMRRFTETSWLRETGVVGRLYFLELQHGIGLLTPFLRLHRKLAVERGFDLEQSYAAFWQTPASSSRFDD